MKSGSGCPDPYGPPSEERGAAHEGDTPRVTNGGQASGRWKLCLLYINIIIYYVSIISINNSACFGSSSCALAMVAMMGHAAIRAVNVWGRYSTQNTQQRMPLL